MPHVGLSPLMVGSGGGGPSVVLVEADGAYPARPDTGTVVFVGSTDPGVAAQDGDVWIDTAA